MFKVALCILVSLIVHMCVAVWRAKARAGQTVDGGEVITFGAVNIVFSVTLGTFLYCLLNMMFP